MEALPASGIGSSARASACGGCHLADDCFAAASRARGPMRGAGLVVASLLCFLVPAVLMLVGAAVAGGDEARQLVGGTAGLVLGMLVATVLVRRHSASFTRESCFEPR